MHKISLIFELFDQNGILGWELHTLARYLK
uniref:Anosmin cysteine rich domain protein n=1 Tax=Podoviridae sp. ctuQh21 TaxID=2825284 RepID=A0A8S5PEG7_9CAUD|nr:MAG TPA: Anosmin cysteine rich domain protein [Podoviridae sp. ctuQh21]DAT30022.1 MAG TPA: Anosmin cysteine rich domain protein [Caudoviricetes sp.]